MLVCFKSEAGSIRDSNHDFVLHDKQLSLVVVAGGINLKSQVAAQSIASSLASSLTEFHSVVTSDDAQYRLKEVFVDVVNLHNITGIGNFMSALWLVNGFIVGVSIGNAAMISLFGEQPILISGQEKSGDSIIDAIQSFDCQKVASGNRVIVVSEGVARAISPKELYSKIIANNIDSNSNENTNNNGELEPSTVLNISKHIYSGDDNTVVVIDFAEKDTLKNTPEEIVLKTHFDRNFSIKLWQPLALFSGLFVAVAFMIKKVHRKIMNETGIINSIRNISEMKNRK